MFEDILNYPFGVETIHRKKRSIKKELLKATVLSGRKIAILGGSSTAEIKDVIELFLLKEGIQPTFYESEYNKYYEDVIFDIGVLKDFEPDIIFIHTSNANIQEFPQLTDSENAVQDKLDAELGKFTSIWEKIKAELSCPIIQNNFEMLLDRRLGNVEAIDFRGKNNYIAKLNLALCEYANANDSFYVNDINFLSARYGLERWHDRSFWYSYKYALSYDAISTLAHSVSSIIKALYGKSKKCLVVDLDNTLWGGVIGDDGIGGIKLGKETAIAEAYTSFQTYILELKAQGVLLAICSKNDAKIAAEAFDHPDSVLKIDDFSCVKTNWEEKHINILEIAEELNIGLDSFVFIDDNPVERDLVRSQLPEVTVPDIGSDVVDYISYLDRGNYFEPACISTDDLKRSEYYQKELKRQSSKSRFEDYGEFLDSLEMEAEIVPLEPVYYERACQLINKTNQFNLTTKRLTLSELERYSVSDETLTLCGRLADKYGDNGLTSVIIAKTKGSVASIDLWLMSCRVFKRELELAMFDVLIASCSARGVSEITGHYLPTAKSSIVANHYERLGFSLVEEESNGGSIWNYSIPECYENRNKHIKIL